MGARSDDANDANMDVAEVYLNLAESIDIDVSANVEKFRSSAGKPVDLGATGSTPTGTAPIIYLSGDATGFLTNKGTGGSFTVATGSLSTAGTSPSD